MADKREEKYYIVYCFTRYQDGSEDFCKLFNDIDKAVEFIQEHSNGINAHNNTFNLFELGKEIPLTFTKEVVPQPPPPPKETIVVSLTKKGMM